MRLPWVKTLKTILAPFLKFREEGGGRKSYKTILPISVPNVSISSWLGKVPTNELQIYTWRDATLKELTSLVREVNPESRRKGTFFDFALIYPSQTPRGSYQRSVNQFMDYQSRDIGTTVSGRKGVDDSKVYSCLNGTAVVGRGAAVFIFP